MTQIQEASPVAQQTPQTSNIPSIPETKKKSPLLTIVLILVFLIIGSGLVYAGMKIQEKKQAPTPSAEITPSQNMPTVVPTEDPTINWKTYTNTKYGFELKYPDGALLKEEPAQLGYGYLYHINIKKDKDDYGINLYLNSNVKKADLRSYFTEIEKNNQSGDPVNPFTQSSSVVKNLLSGEEVFYFDNIYCVAVCKEAIWQNKNKDIVFLLTGRQTEDKTLDQILSTFKFVE